MSKVTIVKNYRNLETLRPMELEDVVKSILKCDYRETVGLVRHVAGYIELKRQEDGSMDGAQKYTNQLPRVCFASELENRKRLRVRKSYSGLVLLEVNNLQSYDEAVAVR